MFDGVAIERHIKKKKQKIKYIPSSVLPLSTAATVHGLFRSERCAGRQLQSSYRAAATGSSAAPGPAASASVPVTGPSPSGPTPVPGRSAATVPRAAATAGGWQRGWCAAGRRARSTSRAPSPGTAPRPGCPPAAPRTVRRTRVWPRPGRRAATAARTAPPLRPPAARSWRAPRSIPARPGPTAPVASKNFAAIATCYRTRRSWRDPATSRKKKKTNENVGISKRKTKIVYRSIIL